MSLPFREHLECGGTEPVAGQYPILYPQFRQPTRWPDVPPQDRYRVPRQHHVHDKVEDDGAYQLQEPLNSSAYGPLEQPRVDRGSKASRGQARPSIVAPQPSKCFISTASSKVRDSSYLQEYPLHNGNNQYTFSTSSQHRLSQIAFDPAYIFQEPSSDTKLGVSSSPAFKADQRRAGNIQFSPNQSLVHPHHHKEEKAHKDNYAQTQFAAQPHRHTRDRGGILETVCSQEELPDPQFHHHGSVAASRLYAPIIQGIQQVLVTTLPDRLRVIFPYPIFNAVQSKCFHNIYQTDSNFLLCSPTGSGKTVVLELAICRAVTKDSTRQYKIVYLAPTKALCSERHRDWQKKFGPLGLNCVELTGDSKAADLQGVKSANIIIITTPEKWDSVTRKWTDYENLMRLVTLCLIDEVHLLKEDRGAILEAVVARMKSIGTYVRFVALSATIPNSYDVAVWLGRSSTEPYEPALLEKFGEEFRPVRLEKHVCGYQTSENDFVFEKHLNTKLPDVVRKYSDGKPTMIFCFTRNSTVATAKLLANWWIAHHSEDSTWRSPSKIPPFLNKELRECAASGVAFHHAGIDSSDRVRVEKAYLEGELGVICCTSTLAIGINLPCHLVIIKNTVGFTQNRATEYSDLEITQMLGRAGRPQYDDSAVAVIMTRQTKVRKYEQMVTGREIIESTLHLALIEHLNAEIGLGTIRDFASAQKWFRNTFLYVRIKQNPGHYNLEGSASGESIDRYLHEFFIRNIALLRQYNLITGESSFRCTEYGYAMAQYYVQFNTMQTFMGLAPKATISEILSAVAQASEFKHVRFRSGEKPLYKSINQSPYIRFPIPVNLGLPAHKVSLLLQSILGAADISWHGEYAKHKGQYNTDATMVFKQINRLIRCIIDCQIYSGDSVSINHALMVERSLSTRVWDDSPLQMKQIETLGVIGCRKLARAGIRSLEELEYIEPHRIEHLLGRNPPYGLKVLEKLRAFPKLRISLQLQSPSVTKTADGVSVVVKVEIGFINEIIPETFAGRVVYVCLLAETSDGHKIHFARLSARKIGNGQLFTIPALLVATDLSINCYVMCDEIAGTVRTASITPKIAAAMFSPPMSGSVTSHQPPHPISNISNRRTDTSPATLGCSAGFRDEFGDDGIDDDELVKALSNDLEFDHIDNYPNQPGEIWQENMERRKRPESSELPNKANQEPRQLANGKWACNHPCKDKNVCKHQCCKQGIDKPPRKGVSRRIPFLGNRTEPETPIPQKSHNVSGSTQTKLPIIVSKRKNPSVIEELDLTQKTKRRKAGNAANGHGDFGELHELHKGIQKMESPYTVSKIIQQNPQYCDGKAGELNSTFVSRDQYKNCPKSTTSSDYGDLRFHDTTSDVSELDFGHINLKNTRMPFETISGHDEYNSTELEDDMELDTDFVDKLEMNSMQGFSTSSIVDIPMLSPEKGKSLFLNDTSSPHAPQSSPKSTRSILHGYELDEPKCGNRYHCKKTNKSKNYNEKGSSSEAAAVVNTMKENSGVENDPEEPLPEEYKDLEPWLYREIGDIVEIMD